MAMHNEIFVTYIECLPAADESKAHKKMEPTADTNFQNLVVRISEIKVNPGSEDAKESFRLEAQRFIAQDFTARILYLVILKKRFESLTPCEYLLSQIDGGRQSIALIKTYLKSFETSDLETIF